MTINFKTLQWLFPIAVTLHNGEEAIWMPEWDMHHAAQLPVRAPEAVDIRIALAMLTAAAWAVTFLSARKGKQSFWAYLMFGSIVAMLVNVVVPHVPAAVLFRGYAPGVVTAVLINLPLMSYLALRAIREGWISGAKVAAFGVGVPIALGAAIAAWLLW